MGLDGVSQVDRFGLVGHGEGRSPGCFEHKFLFEMIPSDAWVLGLFGVDVGVEQDFLYVLLCTYLLLATE